MRNNFSKCFSKMYEFLRKREGFWLEQSRGGGTVNRFLERATRDEVDHRAHPKPSLEIACHFFLPPVQEAPAAM